MLAYVFWHWPDPALDDAGLAAYEGAQRPFHAALAAAPPEGFVGSAVHAVHEAPWAGAARAYEDWYRVRALAALEPLEAAAVDARRRGVHDVAAARAAGGTAGVWRHRRGPADAAGGWAHWFAKPAGSGYDAFLQALAPALDAAGAGLWQRVMTLGPAPEFCALADAPLALPAAHARVVCLRRTAVLDTAAG
jgi:hypothetical protein